MSSQTAYSSDESSLVKTTLGEIKKVIHEEALRGIPDFVLRQTAESFAEEVREQLVRFVTANKSQSPIERKQALDAANEVVEELEKKAYNLLEEELWAFLRNV